METPDIIISIAENDVPIVLSLNEEESSLTIQISEDEILPPIYDGETIITPKAFTEQTLETKNHLLIDDVVVLEIPYASVSNPAGGYTVSIDS